MPGGLVSSIAIRGFLGLTMRYVIGSRQRDAVTMNARGPSRSDLCQRPIVQSMTEMWPMARVIE